jgi:hypothetical protein
MYAIEPVIIIAKDRRWTHPEIDDIVKTMVPDNVPGTNCDVITGPWVRIYLEQDKKTLYTVCVFGDPEKYEDHLRYCYKNFNEDVYEEDRAEEIINEMLGFLFISLVEDVWAPGGEQFCFTDFGKYISGYFDYSREIRLSFMSPDVEIHDDGDHWSFSS